MLLKNLEIICYSEDIGEVSHNNMEKLDCSSWISSREKTTQEGKTDIE